MNKWFQSRPLPLRGKSNRTAFLKAFGRSCRNHYLVVYSRPFTDKDAILMVFFLSSE